MSLSNFNFSNRTACNIASVHLQLCRERFLSQSFSFAQGFNVSSNAPFDFCIHNNVSFCTCLGTKCLTLLYGWFILVLHLCRCNTEIRVIFVRLSNRHRRSIILVLLCVCALLTSCVASGHNNTHVATAQTKTVTITETKVTYVLNTNKRSHRFHRPDCYSAQSIKEENRLDFFGTREEAIARGYKPCGNCNP